MSSQIPPGTNLCTIPAGYPPPGQSPDFHDPADSLEGALVGVSSVLIAWATIFSFVRIFTNRKHLGIGDYFVITGWVLALAYNSILFSFAQYFRHTWDMPLCWYTSSYIKKLYAQGVMLGPSIFFSKAAIFLLYLQIFGTHRLMRRCVYFGLTFTAMVYWAGVGIESYFCTAHPGETWDPLKSSPESHRCPKTEYWGIVQGGCAIAIDLYIFVLPIPIIANLKMSMKRKAQILAVFATALLGIAASIAAEVFRVRLLVDDHDTQWRQSQQLICVIAENWIALIISCMPALTAFGRTYISTSPIYAALRSRLSTSWKSSKDGFDTVVVKDDWDANSE